MPSLPLAWRSFATVRLPIFVAAGLLLTACEGRFSALDPHSPEARGIVGMTWLMFALAAGVMALVALLLVAALWRGRRGRGVPESRLNGMLLVVGGGIVLPLLVLPVLWVLTLQGMAALAQPEDPSELEIEIHGRQWSYEVFYPASGALLVDEVRIPTGQAVLLRLHGEDVIHSFWVPRLGGKTDLIPGVVNETWIRADEPGTYEGRCAEYCGIGHTEMGLTVIALTPADFEAWQAERSP